MPSELSVDAVERGTIAITVSFTDENGDPVTPNAGLIWSLTKEDKSSIVNNRKDVSITPGTSVTVVLSGADLALLDGKAKEYRYLVIEGDYDGSLGNGLPIKDHVKFAIQDIAKVPA